MTKHLKPNPAKLPLWKRTAATLAARRKRCPDCRGVLPEYLCACGGGGCMECNYNPVKPCKCGVK